MDLTQALSDLQTSLETVQIARKNAEAASWLVDALERHQAQLSVRDRKRLAKLLQR